MRSKTDRNQLSLTRKFKTRAQLLLTWPCNVAWVEFSLSSKGTTR